MSPTPIVSVILPVYNGEKYLSDALKSILGQSFSDFEVIAINDGSQDNTLAVLQQWQEADSRIRIVSRENRGLVHSLNEGLSLARGQYIARMDADDISFPDRIKCQVEYLDRNPDVALLGVSVVKSLRFKWKLPIVSGKKLSTWGLTFHNNMGHPGIMLRSKILRDHGLAYRDEYKYAEDFKLWNEIICHGYADILPTSLLYYRVHPESVSAVNQKAQALVNRKIVMENLSRRFGINMEAYFNLDIRSWIIHLTEEIFSSRVFNELLPEDQTALRRAYMEYCAGFGIKTFLHCIRTIGIGQYISAGSLAPILFYRTIKRQLRKEWLRLEI